MAQLCKNSKNPCSLVACPSSKQPHQKSSQQNSEKSGDSSSIMSSLTMKITLFETIREASDPFCYMSHFFVGKKRLKHGKIPMATVDENPACSLASDSAAIASRGWYIFHLSHVEMRPHKKTQGLIHIYILYHIYIYIQY